MADIAIHYGANPLYPSKFNGVTPMELAVHYGNDTIMDIMEEHRLKQFHQHQASLHYGIGEVMSR